MINITPYLIEFQVQSTPYTAKDIWDAWVVFVNDTNGIYMDALRQSGGEYIGDDANGDPVYSPIFLYLQNQLGWRISTNTNTAFAYINANLFPQNPDVDLNTEFYTPIAGMNCAPSIQIDRSTNPAPITKIATGSGVTEQDKSDIISGVWSSSNRELTQGTRDFEIDSIKSQTDKIPNNPTDVSDLSDVNISEQDKQDIVDGVWNDNNKNRNANDSAGKKLKDNLTFNKFIATKDN